MSHQDKSLFYARLSYLLHDFLSSSDRVLFVRKSDVMYPNLYENTSVITKRMVRLVILVKQYQ